MIQFNSFLSTYSIVAIALILKLDGLHVAAFDDNPFTLSSSWSESDSILQGGSANLKACKENPKKMFRYKLKDRTCGWIVKKPQKQKKRCKKKQIRRRCPITCNVRKCRSISAHPSSMPTTMPSSSAINDEIISQGKKGIGFTLRDEGKKGSYIENLPKIRALNPSWVYTWGPKLPDGVPSTNDGDRPRKILRSLSSSSSTSDIDFFPMLWGYYPTLVEQVIEDMKQQNQRVVFGFNEPDSETQSNIPMETAIDAWPYLESLVDGDDETILVSPSCVHALGPWMESFMDQVEEKGLRVDAIGVHYYGGASFKTFCDTMKEIRARYGNRPIIITEFAVCDWEADSVENNRHSPDTVLHYMESVLNWMEQPEQNWILGYAWFPFATSSPAGTSSALFDINNELTPLGEFYSTYQK